MDNQPEVTGSAQGRFLGLDLVQPMYIGSVPDFGLIESNAGAVRGFIGKLLYLSYHVYLASLSLLKVFTAEKTNR